MGKLKLIVPNFNSLICLIGRYASEMEISSGTNLNWGICNQPWDGNLNSDSWHAVYSIIEQRRMELIYKTTLCTCRKFALMLCRWCLNYGILKVKKSTPKLITYRRLESKVCVTRCSWYIFSVVLISESRN